MPFPLIKLGKEKPLGGLLFMELKACTRCKRELGLDRFSKDKKLKSGLDSWCKDCRHEVNKVWRDNHKEYVVEHNRQWQKDNKEYTLAQGKISYAKNRDKKVNYSRQYRIDNAETVRKTIERYKTENKDIINIRRKLWRENNREKEAWQAKQRRLKNIAHYRECGNKWYADHPEVALIKNQRRRALKRKLVNTLTKEQWATIKTDFNNRCAYCNKEDKLTVEHFVPLSKQGELTTDNILPICSICNSSRGNRDFFIWFKSQPFYSKARENKILKYLGYKQHKQQLSIF